MKRIKYILLIALVLGFTIPTNINKVDAASFSISGPSSVSPGQAFSITVSASGGEGSFSVSASGGASVGKNPVWSNESTTITAPASGSFTVTVACISFADENAVEVNLGSKSKTITVNTPSGGGSNSGGGTTPTTPKTPVEDTRSKDNNLASLAVAEGALTPGFAADIVDYNVNLDASIKKVNITAAPVDAKAKVTGTGEKDVAPGDNVFEVIVTAENGGTKKYTIKVIVDETPTTFVDYGNGKLGVVKNLKAVSVPAGFEETTVTINGEEVKAWTNGNMKKTIVYLINEKNEKNFYIYDNGIKSIFYPLALLGRNVYMVDIPSDKQKIEGMKFQDVVVDGNTLKGWAFEDKAFANYSLISVMNELGDMVYYQYESTENTMQLYSNSAPVTMKDFQSAKNYKTYTMIAAGIAGVIAIAAVAAVVLCLKYKKANAKIVNLVSGSKEG